MWDFVILTSFQLKGQGATQLDNASHRSQPTTIAAAPPLPHLHSGLQASVVQITWANLKSDPEAQVAYKAHNLRRKKNRGKITVAMERETEEEADRRREAAIASSASLRPNFKPKSGVTDPQLSKFQELHRRRLQIKAKSKVHKRDKGGNGKGKSHKKAIEVDECVEHEPSKPAGDSTSVLVPESREGNISSEKDNVTRNLAPKTRQKLYWGLDTRERWERKSNM
ncbi:hypothetical protein ACS0TY_029707 [Phlomoides rotata]